MAKTMSPSETITAGQIGKIQEILGAALRKSNLQSNPTQQVLETQGDVLATELVVVILKRVEAVSNIIIRCVSVNRDHSPQGILDATSRKQYTNSDVVAAMPKGKGGKAEVVFFKLGHYVSDNDLEKEYELRGLKPADSYSIAAINEVDPTFADEHPNTTHWKDTNGNWCYIGFRRWNDRRYVYVYRRAYNWYDSWWFAGLRK